MRRRLDDGIAEADSGMTEGATEGIQLQVLPVDSAAVWHVR